MSGPNIWWSKTEWTPILARNDAGEPSEAFHLAAFSGLRPVPWAENFHQPRRGLNPLEIKALRGAAECFIDSNLGENCGKS